MPIYFFFKVTVYSRTSCSISQVVEAPLAQHEPCLVKCLAACACIFFFHAYVTTAHDCRYVTVALAIAQYYWTRGNRDVMPRFPVLHAARTTLRWSIFTTYQNSMHCILQEVFILRMAICVWQQQLSSALQQLCHVCAHESFHKGTFSHCHHHHHHHHHQSKTHVLAFATSVGVCAECLVQTHWPRASLQKLFCSISQA